MKKIFVPIAVVTAFVGMVVLAGSVAAQDGERGRAENRSSASSTSSSTLKRAVRLDNETARLQERANKEIDRRITALNRLQVKIQAMKKVSVANKATFAVTIQAELNLLNNLKIKINADTDITTLKADVQSIGKAYRVYALVLPQIQIMAAADRLASSTDLVAAHAAKLQTRINEAEAGGRDVTAMRVLLTDMNAKIADARIQAVNATAGVIGLRPDNGDKTIMTANLAALKAARENIRTGSKDLKEAHKDGVRIRIGLKTLTKNNVTATSTATTTDDSDDDSDSD